MDVITMEATAYKELIRKIEKIADYVFKKEIGRASCRERVSSPV